MSEGKFLYICPECFQVCDTEQECHSHQMIECYTGSQGDPIRRPLTDSKGNLVSRAPRWYLEARGWIPAWSPMPAEYYRAH